MLSTVAVARGTTSSRTVIGWALVMLILLLSCWLRSALADDLYTLGTADKLKITIFERPLLSGEYRVGPSGAISIPSMGRVQARGLSTEALAERISEKLELRAEQSGQWVSVEILEYRPVYIVGNVRSPGSYPYAMGMSVLHALALAGGVLVPDRAQTDRRLDLLRSREALSEAQASLGLRLAQRARLEAELDGTEHVEFPVELQQFLDAPQYRQVIERDTRVIRESLGEAERGRQAAERAVEIIEEQIASYRSQHAVKLEEEELLQQEIKAYEGTRGAVSQQEIRQLQRLVTVVRGEQLELIGLIAQARERIERIMRDYARDRHRRRLDVAEELSEVEDGIAEIRTMISQTRLRVAELEFLTASADTVPNGPELQFAIIRESDAGLKEKRASELTPIKPGDIVKVSIVVGER